MTNIENVRAAIKPEQTKLMWIETPTNPTLKLIDIEAVCVIAKENKILTVVDNTFATPYLQTPLELGADYSVNSGTKYLGGHSDVVFGTVTVRSEDLHNSLFFSSKSTGYLIHRYFSGCPSIFDCYLVLRSLKTLELRVKAHVRNAYIIARHLEKHPLCDKVIYPGLESHP
jgi:cystathionine gamma-lyase